MGCDSLTAHQKRLKATKPVIYCIVNRDDPAWVKIGRCTLGGKHRLSMANTFSRDRRFLLAWTIPHEDIAYAERVAHQVLAKVRHPKSREWFFISPSLSRALIVAALSTSETDNANSSEPTDGSRKEPAQR